MWREKMDKDQTYEVTFKGKVSVTIAVNAFQWSFETYGSGYNALVPNPPVDTPMETQLGGANQCY